MPEFSACYFCGTALDAPLSEYPVVPKALHPSADQQRTVVLCPTYRRKLGAIVDTVLQAVDDTPDADSIQQELDESSGHDVPSASAGDGISPERLDAEESAGKETSSEVPDPSGSRTEPSTSDDDDAGFGPLDEGSGADAENTDSRDTERKPQEDHGAEETQTGNDEETVNDPLSTADQSGSATTDAEGAEESADDADDAEPEMTALEYNKVMRLLQNREFPVDKAEFKVVATNAYELGDDEFEAVIEAAENRGLIGVDGGQIVEG